MTTNDKSLGDIASCKIFENEKIRIWNLIVEPGESSDWHLHKNDYVTVVVQGGNLHIEYDNGTIAESPSQIGSTRYHKEHKVHRVTNNTDITYKNILIEIK